MVPALPGAAVVMFALNRPRTDVVAVIMMVALPTTWVISMSEALVGLSDPNIVLIAALFVIGEALVRTGLAQRLGAWLTARAGASRAKLIFLLMLIVAAHNKGSAVCTNKATIWRETIEAAVPDALEHYLMDEEALRIFCEEYAAERNRQRARAEAGRAGLEKELRQISSDHTRLVDAIIAGVRPSR